MTEHRKFKWRRGSPFPPNRSLIEPIEWALMALFAVSVGAFVYVVSQ